MRDIHHYERNLEGSLRLVNELPLNNQKAIREFVRQCQLEEISTGRIAKYVNHLKHIAIWLNKDFDKVTKKDIEDLMLKVREQPYTEWTKKDYKVATKKFFRFLKKEELVSWIITTMKKNKDENLPNEVYTLEEVEKLIEVADNPRSKLLISLLYESGARISELLNIKVKDIKFEQDYAMINVMGKTGNREIPICKSIPLLKVWLNYNKGSKEDYIFDMEYKDVTYLLKKLFKKADINKPMNPHQFRHSRATELAKIMTEAQMKQFFGWTQASTMAGVYVHLSGRDLLPKLVMETKKRKCLKCGFENPMDLKFCSNCLMPLEEKEFKEKVEQEDIMKSLSMLASQDKEWLKMTAQRLQRLKR